MAPATSENPVCSPKGLGWGEGPRQRFLLGGKGLRRWALGTRPPAPATSGTGDLAFRENPKGVEGRGEGRVNVCLLFGPGKVEGETGVAA